MFDTRKGPGRPQEMWLESWFSRILKKIWKSDFLVRCCTKLCNYWWSLRLIQQLDEEIRKTTDLWCSEKSGKILINSRWNGRPLLCRLLMMLCDQDGAHCVIKRLLLSQTCSCEADLIRKSRRSNSRGWMERSEVVVPREIQEISTRNSIDSWQRVLIFWEFPWI